MGSGQKCRKNPMPAFGVRRPQPEVSEVRRKHPRGVHKERGTVRARVSLRRLPGLPPNPRPHRLLFQAGCQGAESSAVNTSLLTALPVG